MFQMGEVMLSLPQAICIIFVFMTAFILALNSVGHSLNRHAGPHGPGPSQNNIFAVSGQPEAQIWL